MNKQNAIIKVLLPLVAIVVIFEAVVLVNSLNSKGRVTGDNKAPAGNQEETVKPTAVPEAVMNLSIEGDEEMTMGKVSPVKVVLTAKNDYQIDAINLFVKYDPQSFDIRNLRFDPSLPRPTFSKASTTKGLVVVNYMITQKEGLKAAKDGKFTLVTFDAVPKAEGNFEFEINSGKEAKESATMIVETESSKVLPFSASKLTVSVN